MTGFGSNKESRVKVFLEKKKSSVHTANVVCLGAMRVIMSYASAAARSGRDIMSTCATTQSTSSQQFCTHHRFVTQCLKVGLFTWSNLAQIPEFGSICGVQDLHANGI
jgi:hypothetical protein